MLLRDPRARLVLGGNFLSCLGVGVTMIAVPWQLVRLPGGDALFGLVTTAVSLGLVLLLPTSGHLIDNHDRRRLLVAIHGGSALLLAACTGLGLAGWIPPQAQLTALYASGVLFYFLHFPTLFALNQQLFRRDQYGALAGLIEIQGQTASLVAGGVAAALLDHVPLGAILGVNVLLFLGGTACFAALASPGPAPGLVREGFLAGLQRAGRFLHHHPRLTAHLTATFLPFVAVMGGLYVWPVFVDRTLRAPGTVFAAGEIAFAIAAMAAGALVPRLADSSRQHRLVVLSLAVSVAAWAGMAARPGIPLYLACIALIGWGNAATRVARSTLVFHRIPNALMGRVNLFYSLVHLLLRALLLALASALVSSAGPRAALLLLATVVLLAFVVTAATPPQRLEDPTAG